MHPRLLAALLICACSAGAPPPATVPPQATPPKAEPPPSPNKEMTLAESGVVPEWLDRKADPCTDFFEYACGGFLATAVIPPDRSSWSAIAIVNKRAEEFLKEVLEKAAAGDGDPKLGAYYAACMDEAAIEKAGATPLEPHLAAIAKVKDAKSAGAVVTQLHAAGIFPFFDIYPTQDFADATQVIAELDQSGLGLPDRDYYLKDSGNMKSVRATYREHVGRMFGLLGVPPAGQRAAVEDVMRIETELARLQQDKVFRRDPHNMYHRVELAGLMKAAPAFDWKGYLAGVGIPEVTAITVNDPKYYGAVTKLLAREKPAALRNYLTWQLVGAAAPLLSKAFVDEDHQLVRALAGIQEVAPRWRRCVIRADEDLGQLLGKAYVAAKFAGDSKAQASDLTRSVLDAMAVNLDELPWMDAPTRAAARKKLETMGALVGYPDTWRSYDFDVKRDDHFGNVLAATRFEHARQLAKIGKPVDRGDWEMTPQTVNAYYEPTLNQMALPAGQLQPPFFGADFHPAVNFGGTGGSTIGHEMTHGFDDEGSQFDASGNLRDWWSAGTKKAFGDAAQCVVDQYAKYEAVPGVYLDGKLTAGENIADVGGVKIGYQAYELWKSKQPAKPPAEVDGYSDAQLYFLSYGQSWCSKMTPETLETRAHSDPHSPPRWRVNGVIVDQPGFAPAFKCAAGTPMNPGKTCAVW